MTLNDPAVVRAEYETDERFRRRSLYEWAIYEGPDPREHALLALHEARPDRILDVGCGTGELAARAASVLGAAVVGLDQSERMVELTRARGIEAVAGDVQDLVRGAVARHLPELDLDSGEAPVTPSDPAYMRDPRHVREQYASETNLAARASLYEETTGPFAGDVALAAVAEAAPERVLEVGCGTGWFAARVQRELGAKVVAVDQSERMVELAQAEGIVARVGDVQELEFADDAFDCVAANWMLYHVPDLDRGVSEIARVLRPGGRLVAVTVGTDHLLELWQLVGVGDLRVARDVAFSAENGGASLRPHFSRVEVRDASGTTTVRHRAAIVRYIGSTQVWRHLADRVPERLDEPLVARTSVVVFVADK